MELLLDERRRAGRNELAGAMRALSATNGSVALEALPASAFYEPRLYFQLGQPGTATMPLGQLLFAGHPDKPEAVDVVTDEAGVVGFPGFGRCVTERKSAKLTLHYSPADRSFSALGTAGEPPTFPCRPCSFVPGTQIEIIDYIDPLLDGFLAQHIDLPDKLDLVPDPPSHAANLSRALALIAAIRPTFHEWLVESLRAILLFRHPSAESFAALGMHGMVFVNVPREVSTSHFIEELTHQGGHVLFSEATLRRNDFFRVDPDSALSTFTGPDDPRDVYGAFHGLYTEHMEMRVYRALLRQGLVAESERQELRHRLMSVTQRHVRDLTLIDPHRADIFTAAGEEIYTFFQDSAERAVRDGQDWQ